MFLHVRLIVFLSLKCFDVLLLICMGIVTMHSFHLHWTFFLVFEIYIGHSAVSLQFAWKEPRGTNVQIIFLSFVGQGYRNSETQHLERPCGWDSQT